MRKRLLNLCMTALFGAVSTAAWALSDVNGVYQISSAADWEEFAALVNGGEVNACAVLTADIDTGIDGTMIGVADQQGKRYDGTFDGQGHTIKINLYPEAGDAGIFRYIGWRAVIQNLKVTGTITTGSKFAAGIVGRGRGTVRNCWSDVVINSSVAGDATHGGIVAVGYSGTIVENCLVQTAIVGTTTSNCGGVVGWAENPVSIVNCLVLSDESNFDLSTGLSRNIARNDSRVNAINLETYNADPYGYRDSGAEMGACYNNYVTNDWGGSNPATTVVATEDLADGRICYELNNDQSRIGWVQKIGTDPFPVPAAFGNVQAGRVYASAATDCDGKIDGTVLTFSNEGSDQATKHQFDKYGVCTACGLFNFHYWEFDDPTKFDQKDRAVFLRTKEDLDVAEGMNRMCNGFKLNMKLDADIEYIADYGKYIFNPTDWIDGNFDGQGHAVTIGMTDVGGHAGFLPEMVGNVENLILHGSITTNGTRCGSLCGEARMALVRNVFSDVDLTSSVAGDNTSGGMFGWTGSQEKRVENCIYAGTFTLPGMEAEYVRIGGFSGWTDTKTYYTNCALLGNIIGAGDQTQDINKENSQNIGRNPGNVVTENVYVVNPIFGKWVSDHDKYIHYENEAGIANGELAFFLNGKQGGVERFFQLIGTDPEPMPIKKEGALVYSSAGQYQCDGTPIGDGISYTNSSSGEAVIPPHTFVDGFCTVCGKFQEDFLTPVDGWFELSTGQDLYWWALYAAQHQDACAKLVDDIDMSEYSDRYTPPQIFVGEFDGQHHTISNFVLETNKQYQGLIGIIGNGAKIHDFVLDETCSISGDAFCGAIGGTSGGGSIYIYNVGNEGVVITTNQNAAGIVGVDNGGSMDMFITNCWVTGDIIGGRESGAICGYSSSGSIVKNCWSTASLPQASIWSSDSFTRGGAQVVNCYEADLDGVDANKQQHNNPMAENRRTYLTTAEEVANGALCYKLNGSQFREPTWFQTLEEDEHPYPYGEDHGVVIFAANQYFCVTSDADVPNVASAIQTYERNAIEDVLATQSVLDAFDETLEALENVETIAALADALDVVNAAKAAVEENAVFWQTYVAKCEEVKKYLNENPDFQGTLRDGLSAYLTDDEAPSDENPLGTYQYIIDAHTATAEEIKAETERVEQWLQDALNEDYKPGNDVSQLIPNYDFSKQGANWTNAFSNSYTVIKNANEQNVSGVEAWNTTGDMYQELEGLKPGYYLVGINGAFRPSNNRYSYNYAAGIYANGVFNYFPTVIEDYVDVDAAEDGVNCNIGIKESYDFPIFDDYLSTNDESGASLIGYVVRGETGMAYAANVGRYQVYTIAKVGEDGKFTVGIKNPGTQCGSDWTGWGALKVVYCGEDADAALEEVLASMNMRAQTILELYDFDMYAPIESPNFPEALKAELQAAQAKIESAETIEAKYALAQEFSDIFQRIYEGKQAYLAMFNAASAMEDIAAFANLNLVEKDEETGEWVEKYDATGLPMTLFSDDEIDALGGDAVTLQSAYMDGTYSTEEALEAAQNSGASDLIPAQDEDGYYLIGTTKQFAAYRAIASEVDRYAKGKLIADVDMAGVAMLPIGHNRGENAQHIFMGEFDGQNHALTNVYIDDANIPSGEYAEPATLFYELQNATAKNFKLTGEFHTSHQFTGPVTRWMSGTSTIDNVEVEATLYLAPNLSGDTSSGGLIGRNGSANSLISNCLVNTHVIGEGDNPHWYFGGVAGWADASLKIQNTLILSEYENVGADGDNSRTISRGQKCTPTNVFVTQYFREAEGTLVTAEQLASGEICWKLNGSTDENAHWFQTLGAEETPHLFGGDKVYYYSGRYTNEEPTPVLNAFAYNLRANKVGTNVVVSFDLNAEAEAAVVRFYEGEEKVYTATVDGELTAGNHKVQVPIDNFFGKNPFELNFKIEVTDKECNDVLRAGDVYKVWAPYGLAVNNNPASKGFGQVLIAETYPEGSSDPKYISARKNGALFAFDQNFKPINSADGTPGFYGNVPFAGEPALAISSDLKNDFKDLRFSADGRLFVARANGRTNSSVWEINPDDLNEPWTPLFTGGELDEATGITYVGDEEQNRMAISLALEGEGEDLKMYVLGGQYSDGTIKATDYNCSIYNIGTAKEWTTVPSANFEPLDGVYTYRAYYVGIHEDGQGGLWYIQSVDSPSAEYPALKHFDKDGNEDYSNISLVPRGARIAITTGGDYIAMPNGNGKVVLYECTYVPMENGRIFLNPKQTLNVNETAISSMAFDYANNLYVASAGSETFSRYTVPGMNKFVVTPGNGIGKDGGDVNLDGMTTIADAVSVLNAMAGEEVPGDADVNGDGQVTIADFVTVLNLMAGE